ncbi:MAG: hypothetical protein IJT94_16935 [Oscillibacter sp.]|nr:hypothetical protein [Oscillibacter sp.]
MNVEKKVIASLNKCYAMSELTCQGEHCFLVAAEKRDPCYLFSEDGTLLETVWTEPGGIMTMTPVPGADGQFLTTQRFFSPNDSKEASIAVCTRKGKDDWERRTLCKAPFVHRFGILNRNGVNYLLVCCLKSGHEHKDDWRFPGAVYATVLPKDLSVFNEDHPLTLIKIKDGMLRNHGYCKIEMEGHDAAVVGCEEGTFLFTPPAAPGKEWGIEQLCAVPASDSVLLDFDGDGKLELGTISPFHGASLTIYHLDAFGNYVPRWKLPLPEADTEFLHATWAGELCGKPTWVVGWRKGTRATIAITCQDGVYQTETIDENTGCANVMHFVNKDGKDVIVATNREIDEAAMYIFTA